MKYFNLFSGLILCLGILFGLLGILLPIIFYKKISYTYIPKMIDSKSFKFTKNIEWNENFENKSSKLYQKSENEIQQEVKSALQDSSGARSKRETKSGSYEINEVKIENFKQSIENKVTAFVSVIYISDDEKAIPNAEIESQKLKEIKDIYDVAGADYLIDFCDPNNQTTLMPTTTVTLTEATTTKLSTLSSTNPSTLLSTKHSATTTSTLPSTTLTPFIPLPPIANCSQDSIYIFQDLVIVYELNGENTLKESQEIQDFISDIFLNPSNFTFNETEDGIQALRLLVLPFPNPMHFYTPINQIPSFDSITSIPDLKALFSQQLSLGSSNSNQSSPDSAVCYFLTNLNNQRRGLPATLIIFSKNVPSDIPALSSCLQKLKETEMHILLIGVGNWNQSSFAGLCNNTCFFKLNFDETNSREVIARAMTNSLRAICSVDI